MMARQFYWILSYFTADISKKIKVSVRIQEEGIHIKYLCLWNEK